MKRLQKASVLLSLIEEMRDRESWCGETNIQKATYFVQELTKVPLGFEFVLYRYGPYSFELTDELTALRADSILELEVRDPRYGPCFVPGKLRDLVIGRFQKTIGRFRERIDFVAEKLGNKKVAQLECLATALYVRLEKGCPKDTNKQAKRIVALKPHISEPSAARAVKEVESMFIEAEQLTEN